MQGRREQVSKGRKEGRKKERKLGPGGHPYLSDIKLEKIDNLSSLQVELDSVIDFDERIWVSQRSTIVRRHKRNSLVAHLHSPNAA